MKSILLVGILVGVSTSSGYERCAHSCVNGFCGITECICFSGWTGERCDEDEDECAHNICSPGSCRNTIGSYECKCPSGWFGRMCEMKISNCTSDDECLNGGRCKDRACECHPDFYGSRCEDPDGFCARNPCVHGFCHSEKKRCLCFLGWQGERCDEGEGACAHNMCSPGTCRNTIGSYECICPTGFSGRLCEIKSSNSTSDEDPFSSATMKPATVFASTDSTLAAVNNKQDELQFVNLSENFDNADVLSNVAKTEAEMKSCEMQKSLIFLIIILIIVIAFLVIDRVLIKKRKSNKHPNAAVFPAAISAISQFP